MSFISFLICSSAIVGTFKNLLFIWLNAFLHCFFSVFSFSPLINFVDINTKILINGSAISVEMSLKNTLNQANCIAGWSFNLSKAFNIWSSKIQTKIVKIIVPNILKTKWIIPVLLALRLLPIVLIIAVVLVPTFAPIIINSPLFISMDPPWTMTIISPVIAEEDWIIEVKINPIRTRARGKSIFSKVSLNTFLKESWSQDSFIKFNPMKIIPNPHIIPPIVLIFSFLIKVKTIPIKETKEK